MTHTTKYGVALLTAGLAVGVFTNRDEWGSNHVVTYPGQKLSQAKAKVAKPSVKRQRGDSALVQAQLSPLARAIDSGQPLRLQLPGREPLDFSFRYFPLLADGYRTTLGQVDRLDTGLRVFEGRAIGGDGQVHTAMLALVNRSVAGVVRLANGGQVRLRSADGGQFESLANSPGQVEPVCVRDPRTGTYRTMSLDGGLARPDWSQAGSASLEPSPEFPMMASSGLDPVTGAPTLVLGGPANPPRYEASLKVATVIVALDKSATGVNSKNHLTEVASQHLALMANVAAIYENQLGIRLLVQELILTPDSDDYDDIPFDDNGSTLEEFQEWVQRWRRAATYGQTVAIRFGDGLSGGIIGIAYQDALHTRDGVGVMKAGFGWALTCHEMGHVFGSSHSLGGIMNAQYTTEERSFFMDIEGEEFTAASQIYNRSSGRLVGPASMRNPGEMPFSVDDVAWAAPGEQVRYDVLANDLKEVYRGQENSLALAEVGRVTPRYAGSVAVEDGQAVFTPSNGFTGTAWFSYSVRGDVGRGWLHKGDVAVVVGDPEGNVHELDLAVGQARTLKLPGDGNITQVRHPKQAAMHEMISDSAVYILRVNAEAKGSETIRYRAGGKQQTLKLNYINDPPIAEPDVFYLSPGESVSFNPLTNDHAAGLRGAFKTEPVIAVGTAGEGRDGQDYFPGGFRLIRASSKASKLGSLTVHRSPVMRDGRRRNEPNGLLTFKTKNSVSGTGVIEYTIEDALGQRANGTVQIIVAGASDTLLGSSDYARAWVPTSDRHDDLWLAIDFNDSTWIRGRNGAGYERSSGYQSLISSTLNFRTQMYNKTESLYLRYAFDLHDPVAIERLTLRMKYDDGFVAYLNGIRVASANAPAATQWDSGASTTHDDSLAIQFESFDITPRNDQLKAGKNVLAIHGLNSGLTSSDMLIVTEIVATNRGKSRLPEVVCEPTAERTPESVTLAGRLGRVATITRAFFVWGKTDGGPDAANWDQSQEVTPDADSQLRHQVDGLAAGSVLYYRLYAKNKLGTAWSVDTQMTSTLAKGLVVARADEFIVQPGGTLRLGKRSDGVLANDAGVSSATQAQLLAKPKHGRLTFRSDGTFDYMPDEAYTGTDRFLYRLAKGGATLERMLVSVGGEWHYYDLATAPSRNWAKSDFDDSAWQAGPGLLGYGNGNEATQVSYGTNPTRKRATVYFRQIFDVEAVELIDRVTFKLLRDDAAAVYLNGIEVYRDKNLSRTARHTTYASSPIVDENAYATFEVDGSRLGNGKNVIASEVHQVNRTSSDLSFALFGKAHQFPGAWVTLKIESDINEDESIILNVKVKPFKIIFASKLKNSYTIESSDDLSRWESSQVINGTGDNVEFIPISKPTEKARFFRVRLNR
ncbi:MAG: Ig-like domain-containing protein [Verrucomicrobiota bacterium]|nr:Ig-like domain-containing protein [Verrucomicrobiota bacterium]